MPTSAHRAQQDPDGNHVTAQPPTREAKPAMCLSQQQLARAVQDAVDRDPLLVSALREAIREGSYRVDARRVARKLLVLERRLERPR
jgi:anti-sigma28 factor (negative regulator of flagellin synthesis)